MSGVAKAIGEIRAVMQAAGYRQWNYRIVLQSYPSPVPRAAENRYPEAGLRAPLTGGCPFYDSRPQLGPRLAGSRLDENLARSRPSPACSSSRCATPCRGARSVRGRPALVDNANPPSPVTSEWSRAIGVNPILQGRGIDEEAHPNAFAQMALGRCVTLLSTRSTGSWACRNTPGQGTDAMTLTQTSSSPERFRMKPPGRAAAGQGRPEVLQVPCALGRAARRAGDDPSGTRTRQDELAGAPEEVRPAARPPLQGQGDPLGLQPRLGDRARAPGPLSGSAAVRCA